MFARLAQSALLAATLLAGLAGVAQADERRAPAGVVLAQHRDGHWDRGERDHGRWDRGPDRGERSRWRDEDRRAERCEPGRALRKAERMGVRRADIVDVNRRAVVVAGFRRGQPTAVRFAQASGCPVIGYR